MQENKTKTTEIFNNAEKGFEGEPNPHEVLEIIKDEFFSSFNILEERINDYGENITEKERQAIMADMMILADAARLMREKIERVKEKK